MSIADTQSRRLLYANNKAYIDGKSAELYSKDEIIENLKWRKNIRTYGSLFEKAKASIIDLLSLLLLLFISALFLLFGIETLYNLITGKPYNVNYLVISPFSLLFSYRAYLTWMNIYNSIFERRVQKNVEAEYKDLISNGKIIDGEIKKIEYLRGDVILVYEYKIDLRAITGKYIYKNPVSPLKKNEPVCVLQSKRNSVLL